MSRDVAVTSPDELESLREQGTKAIQRIARLSLALHDIQAVLALAQMHEDWGKLDCIPPEVEGAVRMCEEAAAKALQED